jgi:hypothetical protein
MVKIKKVELTWEDAHHDAGPERTLCEIIVAYKPCIQVSIGWLLVNDAKKTIIAMSEIAAPDAHDTQYRDYMIIPKGMVRKIRTLK